jgi:Ca-activated chloride channel family protein
MTLERHFGSILVANGLQKIAMPLASVDIAAKVIDRIAQVTVKQVFRNQLQEHMEAVYIFPLAPSSAISSVNMKVGSRELKGVVQERAEARQQYQQALQEGRRTALMEQERDDVFTVQVGNLPPGEEVCVEISYSERLPFLENGSCELRLPTVVAPRYIPGSALNRESVGWGTESDTDLVPDASRISPPRLTPGSHGSPKLSIKVELLPDENAQLSDLSCSQHATKMAVGQAGMIVELAREGEKLNRDFVLRWRNSGAKVKTSLFSFNAPDGEKYGVLSIMPPKRAGYLGAARDIVFVLDRSGSMNGIKMTSAVRACSILLNTLGPNDRFSIAAFDNAVEWMPTASSSPFLNADAAGIETGEKFLRSVTARGGTEMDNALRSAFEALSQRTDQDGKVPALVVLTDGDVGNESQILRRIQTELKDSRLFAVGIDTTVNSGLLKRLVNLGGGTAAFVEPGIQLEEALSSIAREIGTPLVTDMQVENLELAVDRASLSPSRIPDLFVGRASVAFFKLKGKGRITVKGRFADGKQFEEKVKAQEVQMPAIAQLWAKAHIVDLEDQFRINPQSQKDLKKRITDLAVKHSLLCKFTAFVVVDQAEIVNKTGTNRSVIQAVEMPADWELQQSDQCIGSNSRLRQLSTGSSGMYGSAAPMFNAPAPSAASASAAGQLSAAASGASPRADAGFINQAVSATESCANSAWDTASQSSMACEASGVDNSPAPSSPQVQESIKRRLASFKAQSYSAFQAPDASAPQPQTAPTSPPSPPAQPSTQIKGQSAPLAPQAQQIRASSNEQIPPGSQAPTGSPSPIKSAFDAMANAIVPGRADRMAANAELAGLRQVISEFLNDFDSAFKLLKSGNLPDAAALEDIRLILLRNLAPTKLGMELPCLQRFLRASAIELISAIKDDAISSDEKRNFWVSKEFVFAEVCQEFADRLAGREAAFWDSSV